MLSHAAQIAPLRRLAIKALESYHSSSPSVRFIPTWENTTFRVDATVYARGAATPRSRHVDSSCEFTARRHGARSIHRRNPVRARLVDCVRAET